MSTSKSIWNLTADAVKYAQARPSHPKEIVRKAVDFLKEQYKGPLYQAVDVGCGSGLSTINLFGEFQSIVGVDPSQAMIEQARLMTQHGSVKFDVASAEKLPLNADSVQLVIAGRAIHYFDTASFYKEVDRVLVTGGVLCYYSVHFPTISSVNPAYGERINKIFWSYLTDRLAGHWPVNRFSGHVIDWRRRDYYFNTLVAPYPAHTRGEENIVAQRSISIQDLGRELETYSAFVNIRENKGDHVAEELLKDFRKECEEAGQEEEAGQVGDEGQSGEELHNLTATDSFFMVMSRKS
jgi:ubiquinone/menaquinone biosynthesis C-methylase UbiE